jgi:hypothetical protein
MILTIPFSTRKSKGVSPKRLPPQRKTNQDESADNFSSQWQGCQCTQEPEASGDAELSQPTSVP